MKNTTFDPEKVFINALQYNLNITHLPTSLWLQLSINLTLN